VPWQIAGGSQATILSILALPPQFMIQTLLTPVRADAPCGDDLSFAPEFDRIAEMRREDDATLDQGDWVAPLKAADWPGVKHACEALLSDRTKDLRIAVWWAEAATRLSGYAGLRDGLALCTELCGRYWDSLHPLIEAGDVEQRVGNLSWMLARLPDWCAHIALCDGPGGRFSQRDIESAQQLAQQIEAHPDQAARLSEGRALVPQIQKSQRATLPAFYAALAEHAVACVEGLRALQVVVDARLGAEGPAFSTAREALDAAAHQAQRLAREAGVAGAVGAPADASDRAPGEATAAGAVVAAGPIASRADALRRLREVAEFFRRTEPHSPVAYLADKAARWGDLPLHLWLRTVVKDAGAIAMFDEMLGVEPPREGE
jgi:type VI secretion system protein ImpA